jgi:hypothetical protein
LARKEKREKQNQRPVFFSPSLFSPIIARQRPIQTMIFARTATRFATRLNSSSRSAFLSTRAVRSNNELLRRAAPFIIAAGGFTIAGVTYNNTECDNAANAKVIEASIKKVEDKFATYWPRNIMVSF